MRQSVHRKLGHKGVGALYNDSETFQEAIALFYSLAFVPEADVENVFYDVIMPSNQIRMDELRALCRNYNSMEKIDFLRQCSARY